MGKFVFKYSKKDVKSTGIISEKSTIYNIGTFVDGVGISLEPNMLPDFNSLINYKQRILYSDYSVEDFNNYTLNSSLSSTNIVFHVIAGLFPVNELKILLDSQYIKNLNNLLILGYKQFGRAANTDLPESLPEFENVIKEFIVNNRNKYTNRFNIAFDNLALEQLHMKDFISDEDWDHLYLGKEGSCSMYIDAVNETYARSSTSVDRTSWNDISLLDYFKSLRNESNN